MTIAAGSAALASDVALGANMPSGFIGIWTGTIATIPAGWLICDGNSSTHNLLTRFIEGVATAATNPGTTGGATSKDLDSAVKAYDTSTPVGNVYGTGATELYVVTGETGSGGSMSATKGKISDIRPLYYDVAFIMKS